MFRLIKRPLIVAILLSALLVIVLFAPHILSLLPTRHNPDFTKDTNRAIITVVNQALRAHYRTYNKDVARSIFSEELIQRIEDGEFRGLRDRQMFMRRVDRNYMQTLEYVASRESGERLLLVQVRVYESFSDMRTLIHWYWIKRNLDGTYIIVDIEYDT